MEALGGGSERLLLEAGNKLGEAFAASLRSTLAASNAEEAPWPFVDFGPSRAAV